MLLATLQIFLLKKSYSANLKKKKLPLPHSTYQRNLGFYITLIHGDLHICNAAEMVTL